MTAAKIHASTADVRSALDGDESARARVLGLCDRSEAFRAAEDKRRADAEPKAKRAASPQLERRKADERALRDAGKVVRARAGGRCEAPGCTNRAHDVHHLAGRDWDGCHHPDLLKLLCGNGNLDGCHGLAHQLGRDEAIARGLRVDRDTAIAQYRGTWPEGQA